MIPAATCNMASYTEPRGIVISLETVWNHDHVQRMSAVATPEEAIKQGRRLIELAEQLISFRAKPLVEESCTIHCGCCVCCFCGAEINKKPLENKKCFYNKSGHCECDTCCYCGAKLASI